VLSQSQVAIVDLTSDVPALELIFPLTLDADQEVDPTGAALTADGKYLVIGTANTPDLYVIDLEDANINMISLDETPSALVIDSTADQTAIVYANQARVDVMDHEVFDVVSIDLDEPCNRIVDTDAGFSVLFNDASDTHDVYRLDYAAADVVEYVLQNPVSSLSVTPSNEYAVALLKPEPGANSSGLAAEYDNNWGLSIIDLLDDRSIDFALEAEPIGLEFTGGEQGSDYALLLLDGVESVLQIDLLTTAVSTVDLPQAPTGLGSTPSGRFFITHDSPLGLVSVLDPETGAIETVGGFASAGLFTNDTLVRTDDAQ
jgi:DNA-binding beta-propeller fold protein YncE